MNKQIKKLLEAKKEENRLLEEQKKQEKILKEEKRRQVEIRKEERLKLKEEKLAQKSKNIENRISAKIVAKEIKKEIVAKPIIKKVEKVEEPIQKNYSELKKKSALSDKFINFVDNIKFDEKDTPKTQKGMETKTKEILAKINKKLEKIPENELEFHYLKKRKLSQSDD
jgi:hypothetical protein